MPSVLFQSNCNSTLMDVVLEHIPVQWLGLNQVCSTDLSHFVVVPGYTGLFLALDTLCFTVMAITTTTTTTTTPAAATTVIIIIIIAIAIAIAIISFYLIWNAAWCFS